MMGKGVIFTTLLVCLTGHALATRKHGHAGRLHRRVNSDEFYFTESPSGRAVVEGDAASIRCDVSDRSDIQFSWLLDGTILTDTSGRYVTEDGHLLITHVDPEEDAGAFQCRATNTSSGFSLLSSEAYLNISRVVRVTKGPTDLNVFYGNESTGIVAAFSCEAQGDDGPHMAWWTRGRKVVNDSQSAVLDRPGSSSVWLAGQPIGGEYHCVAQNTEDGVPTSMDIATATLHVYRERPEGYPEITQHPQFTLVEVGDEIVIRCGAAGEPEPTIRWLKDFLPVDMTDPRLSITGPGYLEISASQLSDEGKYQCVAENDVGIAYSEPHSVYVRACVPGDRFDTVGDKSVIDNYATMDRNLGSDCWEKCEAQCLGGDHSWGLCQAYSTRQRWWGCQCYMFDHELRADDMNDDTTGTTRNRRCSFE